MNVAERTVIVGTVYDYLKLGSCYWQGAPF